MKYLSRRHLNCLASFAFTFVLIGCVSHSPSRVTEQQEGQFTSEDGPQGTLNCLLSGLYPENPEDLRSPLTPVYLGSSFELSIDKATTSSQSLQIKDPARKSYWRLTLGFSQYDPMEDSSQNSLVAPEESDLSAQTEARSAPSGSLTEEHNSIALLELSDPRGRVALQFESATLPSHFNVSQAHPFSALHLQCHIVFK